MYFVGMPYKRRISHNEGRWTESKAALKSMKLMRHGSCWSRHFSMICWRLKIWSRQDRPFLKPAWFSLIMESTWSFTLRSRMLKKTLPATSIKVIPRLLLQYDRSPFFGNGKISPFPHSFGVVSLVHASWHIRSSQSLILSPPSFNNSVVMLSIPGALFLKIWPCKN